MSSAKHSYELELGRTDLPSPWDISMSYNYGGTRDIHLMVRRHSARVKAQMGTKYSPSDLLDGTRNIFNDAVRKVWLLHTLSYSEVLPLESAACTADQTQERIGDTANPVGYCVIPKLYSDIPAQFCSAGLLAHVVTTSLSSQRPLDCALRAYVYGKGSQYATERLAHYWTAFNGLYSHACNLMSNGALKGSNDTRCIRSIIRFEGLGTSAPLAREDAVRVATTVERTLARLPQSLEPVSVEAYLDAIEHVLAKYRAKGELSGFDWTPSAYLLAGLPYQLRCRYVHGSSPLPIVSVGVSPEVRIMTLCANYLESYLDHNLWCWFDSTWVEGEARPRWRENKCMMR